MRKAIELSIAQGAPVGPDERPIYGYLKVRAIQVSEHFAVHSSQAEGWILTHMPSGLRIARLSNRTTVPAATKISILAYLAEKIEPMAWWGFNKGPESMKACNDPESLRKVYDAIKLVSC